MLDQLSVPSEIELLGYTSKGVILSLGDDRGMTVGRVIDARELLHSNLFERLDVLDRRLVVEECSKGVAMIGRRNLAFDAACSVSGAKAHHPAYAESADIQLQGRLE